MKKIRHLTGKVAYSILFLILVPAGLWYWATMTDGQVSFPALESSIAGWLLIASGCLLMFWSMLVLIISGKGLPMNAYPPPVFVTGGPYRVFRHPVYFGFGVLITGYFILTGSESGLWLVAPLTILGMTALVMGYEQAALVKRFPGLELITIFDLPVKNNGTARLRDRMTTLLLIVPLLLLTNFLVAFLCGSEAPLTGAPLEDLPLLENQYLPYLSFAFILAVPFYLENNFLLRMWKVSSVISLSCLLFLALLWPATGAQCLPPSGQVLFTVPIVLLFLSIKALWRQMRMDAMPLTFLALILVFIQLTHCRSAILHLSVSVVLFFISGYYMIFWDFLRRSSEKIANSWHEWIFWKVRVINHGFYAGAGAFFVVFVAGLLAGREYSLAIMICCILLTICAGLWAQVIEGSEKLKRPFGYYGSVFGILLGSLVVWLMGLNVWVVLGSTSVAMPWGQALGRLRCLVNGCCHGSVTQNAALGIRYHHPRSRVHNISHLKDEMLHPTQLYAIIWLFFVGLILFALWMNHAPNPLLFGLYLILTSTGRFVEEAYRGEAQTPVIRGLRLYQWVAIFIVIVGIGMTMIKVNPVEVSPGFSWDTLGFAAIGGFFEFFAMGVDFPYSNARFSRLV